MAQTVKDSFIDLERHRQLLDANIAKLRKSLQHWQTWEAEYEGLKEEILAAGPTPTYERLAAICRDYEGQLVTPREVEEILGIKVSRRAEQVTNILSRRVDYVAQNVKILEKQVEAAENKLAAATVISTPDVRNEEGLPLIEIIEQLDDEGNVVSGRTETQSSARLQLLEALEKAGVKDLPLARSNEAPIQRTGTENSDPGIIKDERETISLQSEPSRKSVIFAEGTKEVLGSRQVQSASQNGAIYNKSKRHEGELEEFLVIPSDESPEDAALRTEMLQYGIAEVGAVVAELDLENDSDFTNDDFDDEDGSSADDEDGFGRSTKKIVSDEMHQRMIELEKKLGLRMMHNVGLSPDIKLEDVGDETRLGKDSKPDNSEVRQSTRQTGLGKKAVRFAEELAISPTPVEVPAKSIKSDRKNASTPPLGDVIERAPPGLESITGSLLRQKISRFKIARAGSNDPEHPISVPAAPLSSPTRLLPNGTGGKTFAEGIIEREVPDHPSSAPDELDLALLRQEVSTEYYRKRNRIIQKQGGFMKNMEEETGIIPFTEEEGGPKRVSRFKAARLARA